MHIRDIEKEIEIDFGYLNLSRNEKIDSNIGKVIIYEFENQNYIGMIAVYCDKKEYNFGLWDKINDTDLLNVWLDESDNIKVLGIEKMKQYLIKKD